MPASRSLLRLLKIRALEEEQRRLALDSAVAELQRWEAARQASLKSARNGRELMARHVASPDPMDRVAALVHTASAERRGAILTEKINIARAMVEARREEYLAKRVERRQAETLIDESEKRDAADRTRKGQQALDDWHVRQRRSREDEERGSTARFPRLPEARDEAEHDPTCAPIPQKGKLFRS